MAAIENAVRIPEAVHEGSQPKFDKYDLKMVSAKFGAFTRQVTKKMLSRPTIIPGGLYKTNYKYIIYLLARLRQATNVLPCVRYSFHTERRQHQIQGHTRNPSLYEPRALGVTTYSQQIPKTIRTRESQPSRKAITSP